MDVSGGDDRRIGVRLAAFDIAFVWRADANDRRPFWRRSPLPEVAGMVDLSLTGALIVASTPKDLVVGSTVVIEVGGHRGRVRIRRMRPASRPGRTTFAVVFVELSPELSTLLQDRITAGRRQARDKARLAAG